MSLIDMLEKGAPELVYRTIGKAFVEACQHLNPEDIEEQLDMFLGTINIEVEKLINQKEDENE